MNEKLKEKLKVELQEFENKIRENGVEFAIQKAYELIAKREIIDSLEIDQVLDSKEEKALLQTKNVLDILYDDWRNSEAHFRDSMEYALYYSIESITADYKIDNKKHKEKER